MVSRYYLNEKWENAKRDMEQCLDVEFKNTDENIVPEADVERCYRGICDNLRAIIKELEGC